MLRIVSVVAFIATFAHAKPIEVGIFEDRITELLQGYLLQYDPRSIPDITDLHITTDHSNILFSASDIIVSGVSRVFCTEFSPPVPFISRHVSISFMFDSVVGNTSSYSMTGTFLGKEYSATGVGKLAVNKIQLTIDMKAAKYSVTEPHNFCVAEGSFNAKLSAQVVAKFEGVDEINEDINNNADKISALIEDRLNASGSRIEAAINAALCH